MYLMDDSAMDLDFRIENSSELSLKKDEIFEREQRSPQSQDFGGRGLVGKIYWLQLGSSE